MILFHGSDRVVMKPDVLHSRKEVDFGVGFYTTPIEEQARNWCRKFIRRGKDGVVSVYKIVFWQSDQPFRSNWPVSYGRTEFTDLFSQTGGFGSVFEI